MLPKNCQRRVGSAAWFSLQILSRPLVQFNAFRISMSAIHEFVEIKTTWNRWILVRFFKTYFVTFLANKAKNFENRWIVHEGRISTDMVSKFIRIFLTTEYFIPRNTTHSLVLWELLDRGYLSCKLKKRTNHFNKDFSVKQ